MAKDDLTQEQLAALGTAIHGGEPLSGIPGSMQLLEMTLPRPKVKEPEVVEPPPVAKEDPRLVEARTLEREAKAELAKIKDRIEYLGAAGRLQAQRRGVDWDAIDVSGSSLQKAASAEADKRVQARAKHIAVQRSIAGKRPLSDSELEDRARRALAKEARSR